CPAKFREEWEMRRAICHGSARPRSILNENEPAQKRPWGLFAKCTFPVGRPQIMCCAYRFLSPIIEIVAKGGTNMRLELKCRYELSLIQNQHVPQLCWTKKAGKRQDTVYRSTVFWTHSSLKLGCFS